MTRITCFKEVHDDWYSNFKLENDRRFENKRFVHVSLMQLSNKWWRCCVWGNDDFGMELDHKDKSVCEASYISICMMPVVSKNSLKELGFGYA